MTVQPCSAALGASVLVGPEPAANSAMSHPVKSKCSMFLTVSSLPLSPKSMRLPVDREDATAATSSAGNRSEEHTSELQSLMRISYAVFCLKKKIQENTTPYHMTNTV